MANIDREGLAIIYGLKKFYIYLYRRKTPFILRCDNAGLAYIFSKDAKRRLSSITSHRFLRWAIYISGFNYKIEYVNTLSLGYVDALSRLPCGIDHEFDKKIMLWVVPDLPDPMQSKLPIDAKIIAIETEKDIILKQVKRYIIESWSNFLNNKNLKNHIFNAEKV